MALPPGYILPEAQEMMTLSSLAYAAEDTHNYDQIRQAIEAELKAASVLGGHFRLVWLGISPDFGNLMFLARDDRQTARYAIAIRGTDWNFLADWIDDFDVLVQHDWPTANPPDPAIFVAQGAWDGLQSLLEMTSQVFGMTPPPIASPMSMINFLGSEALLTGLDTDLDIFVTGHSLGGALATILGLWLVDTTSGWVLRPKKVNLKSYTFAAPTTGNQAYATYYNGRASNPKVGWQAYRVFNGQDMVPFAYEDITGIVTSGIPLTFGLRLELEVLTLGIQGVLDKARASYVQVGDASNGTAHELPNDPPSSRCPPHCTNPAATRVDFACWAGYEHDHNTYLCLLGAPPVDIPQRAMDTASIAMMPMPDVGGGAEPA